MAFNFLVLFIFDELHSGFIDDADAGEKLVGEEILAQSEGEC